MVDLYLFLLVQLHALPPQADLVWSSSVRFALVAEMAHPRYPALDRHLGAYPPIPKKSFVMPPLFAGRSAVVVDPASGAVLWQRQADIQRPIASLTKMMTALRAYELDHTFSGEVTITAEDNLPRIDNRLPVSPGETVLRADLVSATLIASMNNAAQALARSTSLPVDDFVVSMNEYARELGMHDSYFTDVTGLDPQNTSTVRDIARMARVVMRTPALRDRVGQENYELTTVHAQRRIFFRSTNTLLSDADIDVQGVKTGYLDEAGFTFAAWFTEGERDVLVVLLGEPTSASRFADAKRLGRWALDDFSPGNLFTTSQK
ncbi:MAG: serine hydrolase [Patescibacteria group bacterium]|jgi:D-alanyl-D-alanine endopeptidase (penicillin-binding protein 7)